MRPKIIKLQQIFILSLEDSYCRAVAVYHITLLFFSGIYSGSKKTLAVSEFLFPASLHLKLCTNCTMLNDHFEHGSFAFSTSWSVVVGVTVNQENTALFKKVSLVFLKSGFSV